MPKPYLVKVKIPIVNFLAHLHNGNFFPRFFINIREPHIGTKRNHADIVFDIVSFPREKLRADEDRQFIDFDL